MKAMVVGVCGSDVEQELENDRVWRAFHISAMLPKECTGPCLLIELEWPSRRPARSPLHYIKPTGSDGDGMKNDRPKENENGKYKRFSQFPPQDCPQRGRAHLF